MIYTSDKDKDLSTTKNRCFKCNGEIYFTSAHPETPSGKPTKNQLTGKVIPLDPSTHEYHVCKPEDVKAYSETDEYKTRISEWISKISLNPIIDTNPTPSNSQNHNNNMNQIFEQILTNTNHMNATLRDYKADIEAIKNALKIGTNISSSDVQS